MMEANMENEEEEELEEESCVKVEFERGTRLEYVLAHEQVRLAKDGPLKTAPGRAPTNTPQSELGSPQHAVPESINGEKR
jgi:hypothetical protein